MGRGPTESYYRVLNEDYVEGTITCLKKDTIKKNINTNFPNILNIEPTNRCNLNCIYCPRKQASKGVGNMEWHVFTKIIDEASSFQKLIMLNFHKDGESFLHPRFIDMIHYAKKKDVAKTIHLNSNALCWTDNLIDEILDSGIDDITISLDASKSETYKKHKGIDCLRQVEFNLYNFFEKREKKGLKKPFVRTKIMEFDEISKEEINEFFYKWEGIADDVQVTGIHSWSSAIKDVDITDEKSNKRYPCVIMWYALVIDWNGNVTVCSVDWNTEINIGNVTENSLQQIWKSTKLKEARKAQIEKRYDMYKVCKDCVVWVSAGDLTKWLKEKKEYYS